MKSAPGSDDIPATIFMATLFNKLLEKGTTWGLSMLWRITFKRIR